MDTYNSDIHPNDFNFIQVLQNMNKKDEKYDIKLTKDYTIILSLISDKYNSPIRLMSLFHVITEKNTKIDITKKILFDYVAKSSQECKNTVFLLDQGFFQFIIDNNLFNLVRYNGKTIHVFEQIFLNTSAIKFTIDEQSIDFFVRKNNRLYNDLNTYLESLYFPYTPSLDKFKLYMNYIEFISNQIHVVDSTIKKRLQDTIYRLYMLVFGGISKYKTSTEETITMFNNINNKFYPDSIANNYNIKLKTAVAYLSKLKNIELIVENDIKSVLDFNLDITEDREVFIKDYLENNLIEYLLRSNTIFGIKNTKPLEICRWIVNNNEINIHYRVKIINDIKYINHLRHEFCENDKLTCNLIKTFVELEKYDESSGFYDRLKVRTNIVEILNNHNKSLHESNNTSLFDKIELDFDIRRKFVTLLSSELNETLSIIQKYMSHIKNMEQTNVNYVAYISTICKYVDNLTEYYVIIDNVFNNKDYKENFMNKLCEINYSILNTLFTTRLYNCLIYKTNELALDILGKNVHKNLVTFIATFYNNLQKNLDDNMKEYLVTNKNLYNKDLLLKTSSIFGYYTINYEKKSVSSIIDYYCNTLDSEFIKQESKEEKYDEDFPLEFLDPIMSTIINNPVELPDSKIIMEREVINNHLVFSETDPFNRCNLTLKLLEEHNKNESTIKILEEFKTKLSNWKDEHKI
uniref:U-box domain-containing protein n=1 Tax=viral metagenome TaxID=1070528 RepID=A0A6C0JD77_9ZZZZ